MARGFSAAYGGTQRIVSGSLLSNGWPDDPHTFAIWAYPDTSWTDGAAPFSLPTEGTGSWWAGALSIDTDFDADGRWQYQFWWGGLATNIYDDTDLIAGRWYALVARRTDSTHWEFDVYDPTADRTSNDTAWNTGVGSVGGAGNVLPTLFNNDRETWNRGFKGRGAEAAIWDVALTDAEVSAYFAGYSPLCLRPENLAWYYDAIRGNRNDRMGNETMTETGTVVEFPHPPGIIYKE